MFALLYLPLDCSSFCLIFGEKNSVLSFSVEVIWEIIAEEEELNALCFVKLERAVGGINYFS